MFKIAEKEIAADLQSANTIYEKVLGVFQHPEVMKKIGLTFTLGLESNPDYSRGNDCKIYSILVHSEEIPRDDSRNVIQNVLDLA